MRIKNGLVMVVIVLFIGVAVQPSIAVNPISSDNEEDCSICPKVSKSQIVVLKSLLNRVETLNNELSVVYKLNSKVTEKYQELSDRITTLTDMNKELNFDWDFPIICTILLTIYVPLVVMFAYLAYLPYISYGLRIFILLKFESIVLKLDRFAEKYCPWLTYA